MQGSAKKPRQHPAQKEGEKITWLKKETQTE